MTGAYQGARGVAKYFGCELGCRGRMTYGHGESCECQNIRLTAEEKAELERRRLWDERNRK